MYLFYMKVLLCSADFKFKADFCWKAFVLENKKKKKRNM